MLYSRARPCETLNLTKISGSTEPVFNDCRQRPDILFNILAAVFWLSLIKPPQKLLNTYYLMESMTWINRIVFEINCFAVSRKEPYVF